jgi:hypothetical protein
MSVFRIVSCEHPLVYWFVVLKIVLHHRKSLVLNGRSSLIATFAFTSSSPSITSTYVHNSTRPVASYGVNHPWPLPFPHDQTPTLPSSLETFFGHSSAGQNLRARVHDWREEQKHRQGDRGWWQPSFNETDEYYAVFLRSHSWVTMASDFSTYGLDGFSSAMKALSSFKVRISTSFPIVDGSRLTFLGAVCQSNMGSARLL